MTTRQINNEVHSPAWGTYLMNFPLGGWVGLCFDLLTIRYIFHITHITYHLSLITRILCRRNAKQLVDVASDGKVYRAGLFHDILADFPMDSALKRAFVYISYDMCTIAF